jgi:hypothetical protein
MSARATLTEWLLRPVADVMRGLDRSLSSQIATPLMLLAMFASWWLYVPIHELFHAWGCLAAGGTVSRLELDEAYGAAWLAQWFPYIRPGSEYAGRLSGFDTGGSDWVYLVTVFFPYLLTLAIGLPLLYLAIRRASAWLLGSALPWATAPFLSLTGDYYEMGSIVASRLAAPLYPEALTRWRGDDLPLLVETLFMGTGKGVPVDALGVTTAFLLGLAGAFLTYHAGAWLAARLIGDPHDHRPGV